MTSVAAAPVTINDPQFNANLEKATERARSYLIAQLPSQQFGRASLTVMALLKGGTPKETPEIDRALSGIVGRFDKDKFPVSQDHIYDAGVTLMALASADRQKYKAEIGILTRYIIEYQGASGDWDYISRGNGDTSISQYAMLGLWEATRCGVRVPSEVWDRAATWHISRQLPDGGFTYHPRTGAGQGADASSHSMTVAGLQSLYIARRHLFPNALERKLEKIESSERERTGIKYGVLHRLIVTDKPELVERSVVKVKLGDIDEAIEKGVKWLATRFTVDKPTGSPIYYLYGLERLGALANAEKFGDHDWYLEGAQHLISIQTPSGAWSGNGTTGPLCDTGFGFLFITKATAKMLAKERPREFSTGLLAGGRGLPDNLADIQVKQGKIETRKLTGGFDNVLKELENPRSTRVEAAQAAIVDTIRSEPRENLIGQKERLVKLTDDRRPDVRRTAMWALGRSSDMRMAPLLIKALEDPDPDVAIEARLSLRILSRRLTGVSATVPPADEEPKRAEIDDWRTWYRSARPYDERDDLSTAR